MTTAKQFLKFKQLEPRAVLPTRGSLHSAGLDLYSIEDLNMPPLSRVHAHTGLSVAIPEGFYGRIAPRSGLAANHGLDVLSGVIDADYRGEVICLLFNTGDLAIALPAGSKICQLIIEQIITPMPMWEENLEETARGASGFGSTGS
jgi:deoxyuridine 5'-triphosphate nucleotidohydrolase